MRYEVEIHDGAEIEDSTIAIVDQKREKYKVLAKEGLFKNGKHYKTGSEIELLDSAAKNFLNNKDIEPL